MNDVSIMCTSRAESEGSEAGMKILQNIKNTMSDRAATEKKFHQLLQEFRASILPTFVEDWDLLAQDEQAVLGRMNNFFVVCTF